MNKYLPLCLLALSTSSFALDNFDVNTNILTVPEVRAGDVIYKNVIIESLLQKFKFHSPIFASNSHSYFLKK